MTAECLHLSMGQSRSYEEIGGSRWCLDCARALRDQGPAFMAKALVRDAQPVAKRAKAS